MAFNYSHPAYLSARSQAFARSKGLCQFCGQVKAAEAHHWADNYPREEDTTPDDLTALCGPCHYMATTLRRYIRHGNDMWQFKHIFEETIDECFTGLPLEASLRSSTTAQPESTRFSPSTSRSRRSPASVAATAPPQTTPGSESSKLSLPSGSTNKTSLPSRRRPSAPQSRRARES